MFLECMGGIACCGYLFYKNNQEFFDSIAAKNKLVKEWNIIVEKTAGINSLEGFKFNKIKGIKNGWSIVISIPKGKKYSDLVAKKEVIEKGLGCICELEDIRFTSSCSMKLITKDLGKYPFAPVETFANKLWFFKEFDGTDCFIDLDKEGHLLIGGQSGGGKSFGLASVLTNLIYNCSDYIELYLNQTMKGEVGVFANCKCVKSIAYNDSEVLAILKKVTAMIDSRAKLFASLGIKNLTHYIQKTHKKMKRIFFVVEEASFLNNEECYNEFIKIVRAGRSAGIHLIMLVQRSTLENLSGELKSQMCCATTWQRSDIDSRNIIEVTDAKELQEREVYIWGRKGLKLLKMPFLDEDFMCLKKYVPEIITYEDGNIKETPSKTITKNYEEVKFEHILLEDYNRIQEKKTGIVEVVEVEKVVEVKEEVKKQRGRKRKGAIAE